MFAPSNFRAVLVRLVATAAVLVALPGVALAQAAPTAAPDPYAGTGGTTDDPSAYPAPPSAATLGSDHLAVAPAGAPAEIQAIIAAGNRIAKRPYVFGGGHSNGFRSHGYDCSGSVSYALHGAALLGSPLDSSSLESWGQAGKGSWVTIYANSGHTFMVVAGLRFDTSGAHPSRWQSDMRSGSGYTVRHPAGL